MWATLAAVFSGIYLINPTGGFVEFIPDYIPIIGNLDEATVTALLIWAISVLRGKEISYKGSNTAEKAKPADAEVVD